MTQIKDSGVEWLGTIPEKWEICKLKYLSTSFNSSYTESDLQTHGNYAVYGGSGDIVGYLETYVVSVPYIGIVKDGSVGKVDVYPANTSLLGTMAYIIQNDMVDIRWLKYSILSMNLEQSIHKTTIPHIYFSEYGNNYVPLPPKKVQSTISNFLDEKTNYISMLIDNLNKQIESLKDYKKEIISEIVTKGLDPNVPLKDCGVNYVKEISTAIKLTPLKYLLEKGKNKLRVGPFGSQLTNSDFLTDETDYWVYNQRSVLDSNFVQGNIFVNQEKYDAMKDFQVHANDILITTRGSIGKIARVPINYHSGLIHPCIIKFRIDETKIAYDLLEVMFNQSDLIEKQILSRNNSTTIGVLYSDTLKNIHIPLWPKKYQFEIMNCLHKKCNKIDMSINAKQKMVDKLNEYSKSLIYEYVTGKKEVI